jgi:hypothetical protein
MFPDRKRGCALVGSKHSRDNVTCLLKRLFLTTGPTGAPFSFSSLKLPFRLILIVNDEFFFFIFQSKLDYSPRGTGQAGAKLIATHV